MGSKFDPLLGALRTTDSSGVTSVNTRTGDVTLTATDVGLANVDNTSDVNKPVSTAQQTAIDAKVAKAGDTMTGALVLKATAPSAGLLDVRGTSNASQLHFANSNVDSGGYITSAGAGNFFMSGGSVFNGTNWVAKNTASAIVGSANTGALFFYADSSLTSGNTFTPTIRVSVGTDGKLTVLTSGGNKDAISLSSTTANTGITIGADTNIYRSAANVLKTDDKLITAIGLGVGNSAAATTLGTVTKKMEVFDASGTSLGFVPIYDAIT